MIRPSACAFVAALALGGATAASAAVVQVNLTGYVTEFDEMAQDPNEWIPPSIQPFVPRMTGIALGDAVNIRFTYDTAQGTITHNAGSGFESLSVMGENVASARVTVGSNVYDIAGNHGAVELSVAPSSSYAGLLAGESREFSAPDGDDGNMDTLYESWDVAMNLDFIGDLLEMPLSLEREFIWSGANLYAGSFSYGITSWNYDRQVSGYFNFAATNVTAQIGGDVTPPAPVPLPAGLPMLAGALIGLGVLRRRARA
ncbi:MAG: VPLPA-CTERM sorting domain-containing protein [Paracoccus sp. (in: a-proteobacteria)]|nr:VPLPA-CTERM sorting domain-containing protein [Paracoccus sp. (in: a-proteobacteria)]